MGVAPKPRILTGDTPTGKLHFGHFVGSLKNRIALQREYDCYFLIANKHAFTTRAERPNEIPQSVLDIAADYLAVGIDPEVSAIVLQSEVPAIDELTFFFSMLLPRFADKTELPSTELSAVGLRCVLGQPGLHISLS